jgi:hypothetical protein
LKDVDPRVFTRIVTDDGRKDGSVTISLHNFVGEGIKMYFKWILTKLGTYLVLTRIWNPNDFQGQRSRSPGLNFYRITSL